MKTLIILITLLIIINLSALVIINHHASYTQSIINPPAHTLLINHPASVSYNNQSSTATMIVSVDLVGFSND